ncbi:hypothetical protein Bbelb_378070 [Branchiostoma belcheri]|nr:hypothetical protein Bbelb_378070 [Branchiostoma belcheri]
MGVVGGPYVTAIALQFLRKPLGGPSSRHFFPSKRATYHLDFVTPACVDHEISKLEVQLQYHNKPLGGPKSNHFQNQSPKSRPASKSGVAYLGRMPTWSHQRR